VEERPFSAALVKAKEAPAKETPASAPVIVICGLWHKHAAADDC